MNRRGFLGWLAALVPGLAVAGKVKAEPNPEPERGPSIAMLGFQEVKTLREIKYHHDDIVWWPLHPDVKKLIWTPDSSKGGSPCSG